MASSNCDVCRENPNLTYVNIENVTNLIRNLKIEAVGHNDLYFCTETDSAAVVTETSLVTCLAPKSACNYATSEITDLNIDGLWSVELEDGTLIKDKTLEELSEILLEHQILLQIPPELYLKCDEFSNLSSTFTLPDDFDYGNDRKWAFYLNGVHIGTTNVELPNGNKYRYVETLIDAETNIYSDYDDSFTMTNTTEDIISVAFVPTNVIDLEEVTMNEPNDSFSYDPLTGIVRFCLAPSVELEVSE